MAGLTLDQAQAIIAAVREKARADNCKALAIAVVDSGGHVLALAREDGAGHLRNEIAANKAWGCIAFGITSGTLAKYIEGHTNWWIGISGSAGGRLVPSPGGVFIRDETGAILGAVGISGEASATDEALAAYGIEAAGLNADRG